MGCGFDFEYSYGERGAGYIEVHHLRPVSSLENETKIDPKTEMTVVCSNCHRMIHRKKDEVLTMEQIKELIRKHAP
jgi:5-methylcytosine-specific restriction protein A